MRFPAVALLLLVAVTAHAELPSASTTTVRQALASGQPAIVDLGARTCIPCKQMAPILEGLAGELRGKANVLFIDAREDPTAAQDFRIQMIPTQIFFDAKGREVKRHIGFLDREGILLELRAAGLQ